MLAGIARLRRGRIVGVAEHVGMHPRQPHAGLVGEVPQPAGGGMTVHPCVAPVAQQRALGAHVDGAVDRPPYRGRQRDQHDLGALADHPQHPVAVLRAKAGDVGGAGLEAARR